jgi:hypothetical protein
MLDHASAVTFTDTTKPDRCLKATTLQDHDPYTALHFDDLVGAILYEENSTILNNLRMWLKRLV